MIGLQGIATGLGRAIANPITAIAALSGAGGIVGLAVSAVKAASEMDSLELSLEAVAGNAEDAAKYMAVLQEVAKLPGINLEHGIRGFIQLFSVSKDARFSVEVLKEFSNAVALSGRGSEELGRVVYNLTQVLGFGKITGDELRETAMLIPQFGEMLEKAFGTRSTEKLSEMGVSARQAIEGVLTQFRLLARAPESPIVVFENLAQQVKMSMAQAGASILRFLLPPLRRLTGFLENMVKGGLIREIADGFAGLFGGRSAGDGLLRAVSSILAILKATPDALRRIGSAFEWLTGHAKTLGVTLFAILYGPSILAGLITVINLVLKAAAAFRLLTATVIGFGVAQSIAEAVMTGGASLGKAIAGLAAGALVAAGLLKLIESLSPSIPGMAGFPSMEQIGNEADTIYERFRPKTTMSDALDQMIDTLKGGGPGSAQDKQNHYLRRIAEGVEKQLDLRRYGLGGGSLGNLTMVDRARVAGVLKNARRAGAL